MRDLPIPTTLVLIAQGVSEPVLVATHDGCPRRSFAASEWSAMIALAEAGLVGPHALASWICRTHRKQLAASGPVRGDATVAHVLSQLGATLRAVVLEGAQA